MPRSRSPESQQNELLPRFGLGFLEDHARRIITDPRIALVELVANSWDAGADTVQITWPDPAPDVMAVEDNGTGMSYDEFTSRWLELNYNRGQAQGLEVVFPEGNCSGRRRAFGINGKGRHSMFCFASEYVVDTWKDGEVNSFLVTRSTAISSTPFAINHRSRGPKEGHGTRVSAELVRNHLETESVRDLIGSKFIADPTFKIYVNGDLVELTDLDHLLDLRKVKVPKLGEVCVRCIDSRKTGRTSKQHGVAWWVHKRLVGEPSWKGFDEDAYLDARTSEAKRFTFVVEADLLVDEVEADWSGFKDTPRFRTVQRVVRDHILDRLHELMRDVHKSRKRAVLEANRSTLKNLPSASRLTVGRFVDELQARLPSLGQKELSATVEVVTNLEKSRSGYALLEQLAALQPNDLDRLNDILERWSVHDVAIVLSELEWRLKLIEKMDKLLEDPSADELHDIQPLFDRGLWIFGPEYESISFVSNRTLVTVLRELLHDSLTALPDPRRRPDIVALPNSTISIYSRDAFDDESEVSGIAKVLIVELKKGGFTITRAEKQQAADYANAIRRSGKVERTTEFVGFVLGTKIADDAHESLREGNTTIFARAYSTVLQQANARTFNLLQQIRKTKGAELTDPIVEEVIRMPERARLF